MNLPQHPDVAQWRGADASDIDAIFTLQSAADEVDHPTWLTPREEIADVFSLSHNDPTRDLLLGLNAEGEVLALGQSLLHPDRSGLIRVNLGGVVHPEHRRRGIGTAVFAWQVERAAEQGAAAREEDAAFAEYPVEVKAYAQEVDRGAQVLAEAAGFTPQRWFTTMEREMADAVPALDVPEEVALARYAPELSDATLEARNDAFRDHWGSLPTVPEVWARFVGGQHVRPDLSSVVLEGERVVALCLTSVIEEDWERLGASHAYIDLIGVVRDHRRRGLAPAVIAHTLRAIADAGLERAVLDVDTASPTGANSLYEGLGFRATDRSVALGRTL